MAELRGEALRQRGSYKHDIFVTSALGGRVSSNVIVRATKKNTMTKVLTDEKSLFTYV